MVRLNLPGHIDQQPTPAGWVGAVKSIRPAQLGTIDPGLILQVATRDVPALLFLGTFLVYFHTAAPTLFGWDSAEYAATAYNLGVPHATGYPLYVLIGKLFTYVPTGDVAYRLNLMSALVAAGAVTLVYLISYLITRRHVLSLAGAGFLAFSYYFWSSAVIAEVYSLHAFLNALTIYLLLLWSRGGRDHLLYGGIFAWGLSFGNHMTTGLMAPAVAFVISLGLWHRRLSWRHILPLATCFVIPLVVYVYLPLRYLADAVPYVMSEYTAEGVLVRTDPTTLQGMWEILTARQFATLFRPHEGFAYVEQLRQLTFWLYGNFLGIGMALGALGIIRNFLVDKLRLVFLSMIFAANALFFAYYGAVDKHYMFVTGYLVWSIWIAEGVCFILASFEDSLRSGWLGSHRSGIGTRIRQAPWEALAVALPVAALWVNFSYADVSSFTHMKDNYPRIMSALEPNSLVLAHWPDVSPMQYYQHVENLRPDIQLVDRYLISPENEIKLIDSSLPHRPVYVFEGDIRTLPYERFAVPALKGSFETGYRLVPP